MLIAGVEEIVRQEKRPATFEDVKSFFPGAAPTAIQNWITKAIDLQKVLRVGRGLYIPRVV